MGLNNLYLGATREAADWFRRADGIAPRDRSRWTWLQGLGRALLQLGQDGEAAEALRRAVDNNPNYARGRPYLVAAEILVDNVGAAKLHLSKLAELDPGLTIKRFVEERSSVPLTAVSPIYRHENERILDALRRAGMQEQ
jgi:tetratricopeptide (TPR) repeat protein